MTEKQAGEKLVKMSRLAELAGVPAPTIKYYMREGLLPEPARRTSRNMAYYDARLAERVKAIKDLQQRHFLPLRLIGEVLEPPPSAAIRKELAEETRSQLGALAREIQAGQAAATLWPYVLSAHALIHAGGAWVATGSVLVAAFMFATHWWVDYAKCENWTTVHVDQAIHFALSVAAAAYTTGFYFGL